jgi:AcrR family transcriptional regulator
MSDEKSKNTPVNHRKVAVVKPAKQKRSRATRDAILKVVAELVMSGTFETASVQDIVSAAGSSVGAFYGRFSDKKAALFSFYDQRCDELESRVAELIDPDGPDDLETQLNRYIEHMVSHTIAHAAFLQASRQYFSTTKETPFVQRARVLNGRIYGQILPLLRARSDQFNHPNAESASFFLLALVGGLTRDGLLPGAALTTRKVQSGPFIAELKRAVFGYLGVIRQA